MYCNTVFKCIRGKSASKKWYFQFSGTTTVVIGRLAGCHIVVNDSNVSQSHCLIQIQNNLLCLVDMGSKYGTLVNSNPAEGAVPLSHGDEIKIGDTVIQIKILQSSLATLSKIQTQQVQIDAPISEIESSISEESIVLEHKIIPSADIDSNDEVVQDRVITKVYPSPRLHKKCMFCEEEEELHLSGSNLRWQYCIDCKDFAEYICNEIHSIYPILDEPVQIDWHGILIWVHEKNRPRLLYVSRYSPTQFTQNFTSHLEKTTAMQHTNLLTPQKFEMHKNHLCAFYPAVHGEFIFQSLETNFSKEKIMHIATQIANAFVVAEKTLGPHGEFSEKSIFIKANGQIALYGYGLPRRTFFDKKSVIWDKKRSHYDKFTAPEVFSNQISSYSDVFSLAAFTWEQLTQKLLYQNKNHEEILQSIPSYQAPQESSLPTFAKHLLQQALSKYPEERCSSLLDFANLLRLVKCSF